MEVEIDASGRVTIPPSLRTYAGLTKAVVVTGLYDRVELWDEETWNTYRTKTEAEGDAIAERLGEQGV
jgi:MraZ protein